MQKHKFNLGLAQHTPPELDLL